MNTLVHDVATLSHGALGQEMVAPLSGRERSSFFAITSLMATFLQLPLTGLKLFLTTVYPTDMVAR